MNVISINCALALMLGVVAVLVAADPIVEQNGVIDVQPPPIVEEGVVEGTVDTGADDTRDGVLDDLEAIYKKDGILDVSYSHLAIVGAALKPAAAPLPIDAGVEGTIDLAYSHQFAKPNRAAIDEYMPVEFIETH